MTNGMKVFALADEIDRLIGDLLKKPSAEKRERLNALLRKIMPFVQADFDSEDPDVREAARRFSDLIRSRLERA